MSVCFFALSGRGAERVLLDAAATVVPLVAIVPTMISPGSVPGIDAHCPPGRGSCVPASFDAAVRGGVLTSLIVGAQLRIGETADREVAERTEVEDSPFVEQDDDQRRVEQRPRHRQ